MTITDLNRVPAGVTTGGQFSTGARAESDVSLYGASTLPPVRVEVHGSALITQWSTAVPEWPASLGEADLSYERDPETDKIVLSITTDRTGEVEFWEDSNTFDEGGYEGGELSGSERDALTRWAMVVRENVDVAQCELERAALEGARSDILAIATGKDIQAALDLQSPRDRALARSSAVLGAWVDDVDVDPETALTDALTDLEHFARSKGLDLESLFARAQQVAAEESESDPA